jgi:hypothetical protein
MDSLISKNPYDSLSLLADEEAEPDLTDVKMNIPTEQKGEQTDSSYKKIKKNKLYKPKTQDKKKVGDKKEGSDRKKEGGDKTQDGEKVESPKPTKKRQTHLTRTRGQGQRTLSSEQSRFNTAEPVRPLSLTIHHNLPSGKSPDGDLGPALSAGETHQLMQTHPINSRPYESDKVDVLNDNSSKRRRGNPTHTSRRVFREIRRGPIPISLLDRVLPDSDDEERPCPLPERGPTPTFNWPVSIDEATVQSPLPPNSGSSLPPYPTSPPFHSVSVSPRLHPSSSSSFSSLSSSPTTLSLSASSSSSSSSQDIDNA